MTWSQTVLRRTRSARPMAATVKSPSSLPSVIRASGRRLLGEHLVSPIKDWIEPLIFGHHCVHAIVDVAEQFHVARCPLPELLNNVIHAGAARVLHHLGEVL